MTNQPFGFDIPEDSLGFLLWQTTISWQRLIKRSLEPYNISHAQFVIMAVLLWWHLKKKDITQVDIIRVSKLDKMTVSKSLKKLASMDLIKRRENSADTRAKSVWLTNDGMVLAKKLVPIVEAIDVEFFGKLANYKAKELIKILQKLAI